MTGLDELFTSRIATTLPDVIGSELAAEVRGRLDHAGATRYALLDRGSYERCSTVHEPELVAALTRLASELTARALAPRSVHALRLRAGDYLLAHHDPRDAEPVVELMLDLSPFAVPGAEVHYRRRGQPFFRFVASPGALSVVERDADVACNHTYLSKRAPDAEVVRLIVRLAAP